MTLTELTELNRARLNGGFQRECCKQGHSEVNSNSSNKVNQTWSQPLSPSLYCIVYFTDSAVISTPLSSNEIYLQLYQLSLLGLVIQLMYVIQAYAISFKRQIQNCRHRSCIAPGPREDFSLSAFAFSHRRGFRRLRKAAAACTSFARHL